MADQGITLNIYDKPPEINDNTNDNIKETQPGLNLNPNRLPEYPSNLDNVRNNTRSSVSPPGVNYNSTTIQGTGTTESSIDSTGGPNNVRPVPIQQYPIVYQQQVRPIVYTPVYPQGQYNPQYAQPVIVQQRNNQQQNPQYAQPVIVQQRNNQQPTYIINEKKVKKNNDDDCGAGFLAGLCACCAACCLLLLCCGGGGPGGRPGRRGW